MRDGDQVENGGEAGMGGGEKGATCVSSAVALIPYSVHHSSSPPAQLCQIQGMTR